VDDDERREIRHDFGEAVTMTAAETKRWLRTDESQSVGDVHRHLAQRPAGDVTDTKWRYSLMNWGHDPLK
jgi:hypothetical protein